MEDNKQEQIGFHKGSLATLSKEHQEMVKIVQITEELMKAHIKALKDLGVDIEAQAKEAIKEAEKKQETKLDERIG